MRGDMSYSTSEKMVGENIGLFKGLGLLLWLPMVSSSSEVKENTGQGWKKTRFKSGKEADPFGGDGKMVSYHEKPISHMFFHMFSSFMILELRLDSEYI